MHDFNLWYTLLTIAVVLGAILTTCAYLILVERRVAAYVQDRYGPNRVGPFGLLQPLADGLKFILKEDIIPGRVDKFLFLLAPCIALTTALLGFAVVPFGATEAPPTPPKLAAIPRMANPEAVKTVHAQNARTVQEYLDKEQQYRQSYQFVITPGLDIGIVFIFAVASLTVYAIILGGWSANNKYSFIGGLRSSAQIVSYEIPMGLSILGVVLLSGSLNLEGIIQTQTAGPWFICYQPLAFLIFCLSAFAECNRLPFDLPEAEQELVGGYHTEYSAMKFGLFFLGEYSHMITTSFLMVILFFGGWHFPFIAELPSPWLLKLLVFAVKMAAFILFFMLIRWTIPRFRFDQLMSLAWKVLLPMALLNLVCVMFVKEFSWSWWWLLPASLVILVSGAAVNIVPPTQTQRRIA